MNQKERYKQKIKNPFPLGLTHLDCPECKTPVKSENISLDNLMAKCNHCSAVFTIENDLPPVRSKPVVQLPKGIEMLNSFKGLEFRFKWRDATNTFLMFFTIMWNGMLLPFVIGAIMSGELMLLLGTSIHLIIGLCLLYYVITILVNITTIDVGERSLSVVHGPLRLPFYDNKELPVESIEQIYVEEYVSSRTNGRPNYAHAVNAVLKDKSEIQLLKGLKRKDQALYIEQEIEFFLRIDDER